jgi:biopolymer transport protein ExbD
MVTTVHDVDRTTVNLPSSITRVQNEKGSAVVVIHEDTKLGEIVYKFSDGEAPSTTVSGPRDIYFEATRITSVDPVRQFVIKADGTVRYELIDEVLDNLRQAGASNMLLLTHAGVEEG